MQHCWPTTARTELSLIFPVCDWPSPPAAEQPRDVWQRRQIQIGGERADRAQAGQQCGERESAGAEHADEFPSVKVAACLADGPPQRQRFGQASGIP